MIIIILFTLFIVDFWRVKLCHPERPSRILYNKIWTWNTFLSRVYVRTDNVSRNTIQLFFIDPAIIILFQL